MMIIVFLILCGYAHHITAGPGDTRCFVCTSYMEQCRETVDMMTSQGYAHRGRCYSKCFVRLGEDGAIYRGCFDGFMEVKALTSDYNGCRNQTWNGRSLPWCFCHGDLCNKASMKDLGMSVSFDNAEKSESSEKDNESETSVEKSRIEGKEGDEDDSQDFDVHDYSPYHTYDDPGYHHTYDDPGYHHKYNYYYDPGYGGYYDYYPEYYDPNSYDVSRPRDPVNEAGQRDYSINSHTDNNDVAAQDRDVSERGRQVHVAPPSRVEDVKPEENTANARYSNDVRQEVQYRPAQPLNPRGFSDSSRQRGASNSFINSNSNNNRNTNSQPTRTYGRARGDDVYGARESSDVVDPQSVHQQPDISSSSAHSLNTNTQKDADRIECAETGFYQNPEDCGTFVACILDAHVRRPYMHVMYCPAGLVWDNNDKICNEYSATCTTS